MTIDKDRLEKINKKMKEEHDQAVNECLSSINPIRTAAERVIVQWDLLGKYKDDDFGEVGFAMGVLRAVIALNKDGEKESV